MAAPRAPSPLNDPALEALLDRLHAQSDAQVDETSGYFARRRAETARAKSSRLDDAGHRFLADKLVALDRDKAEFCYLLCRALRATHIVEAGTSYGVRAGEGRAADIWEVSRPALELVSPHLRPGAIVACDNTTAAAGSYREYFEFVHDPKNRLRTMTVPFAGRPRDHRPRLSDDGAVLSPRVGHRARASARLPHGAAHLRQGPPGRHPLLRDARLHRLSPGPEAPPLSRDTSARLACSSSAGAYFQGTAPFQRSRNVVSDVGLRLLGPNDPCG